ncbi:non-repetitive/WGA-negative nucleoporin carboxy-terminal protein [Ceratobasidium sp. AG-Ba]|nr:non-repetitive/WGA-negative nucleoporin carboxy-terminal protein [Ceratobasidium sp. AG-Ba]
MFASPAPSSVRARRAAQPAIRQNQGVRRTSAAIRAGSSRLTTPALRGSYGHASPSIEDQDMASEASFATVTASEAGGNATYVKTPELTVMFGGHFPAEVRTKLDSSESNRNASSGLVDPTTGYAFLVTYDTCYVWNPTKRTHGSPTCYIFPTPRQQTGAGSASHLMIPNVSLIPYGSSREPGLIMVSSTGEIRLWESINAGLAGAEQFYSNSVPLSSSEHVSTMYRSEAAFYILGTTSGRLLRMALSSPGGKPHIAVAPFSQQQGLFSFSRFFGRAVGGLNGGSVVAIAETVSENRQARSKNIWGLTERTLQKWTIGDGWEQLSVEYDIRTPLDNEIIPDDQESSEHPELDIELHDLKIQSNDQAFVLFSYISPPELAATNATPSRTYAIASFAPSGDSLVSGPAEKVPYEGARDPRPASNPKLALIDNGNVAFVEFVDALTLQSLNTGSTFKTHLLFKERRWNRTLGFGIMDKQISNPTTSELILMTATAGQLAVQLDLTKIKRVDGPTKANQLRAVMEQAIRFGQDNPFIFRLDPELKEADLGGAAVGLSRDILASQFSESRHAMDLSAHIEQRLKQLQALMVFLNEDRVTLHMSDFSRQSLAADAEKLCAASTLWQYENENSGQHHKSILGEAIDRYMAETRTPFEEGPVRAFFKYHLEALGLIVRNADEIVDETYQSGGPNQVDFLRAANQIVLLIYGTVETFRQRNLGFYGLETTQPSMIPWTSEPDVLESIQDLFTHTGRMLGDRTRDLGNALKTVPAERAIQNELKGQLQMLAKYLFAGYQERLLYLQSATAEDKKEAAALDQQFANYRPSMLRNLAIYDQGEEAFRLAEQYRDFRSLAELCNDSRLASDLRTQNYLELYQQDFASELYQWYVEHGKLQTLLLQDQIYYPLLQGFLKSTDYPRISWLHDVAIGDFHSATTTLSEEVNSETKVDALKLLVSLAKLSTVAETDLEEYNSQHVQGELQTYDDHLDVVEVQDEMRAEFEQIVEESGVRGRPSIDAQADILARHLVPESVEEASVALFKRLAKQLLQRNVLSTYDIVDVLTLRVSKPNYASLTDAASVLDRMPDESALRTLWRRAWIVDDWVQIRDPTSQTDEQIWRNIQQTAVWRLLEHITEEHSEKLLMPPSQASIVPTHTDLGNRFPDLPAHSIELLMSDLELEHIALRRLLEVGDVDEWYTEAVRRVTKI